MLRCLLFAMVGVLVSRTALAAKPNIVVILSDDAGYNEFSMHGSKLFATPRIDSIAANGVRCTNGYASGTVCSPTRAGLLTGRYQNRFGHEFNIPPVDSESNGLSLDETTIADVLKADGYRTIALGKWHLGYAPKFHPMERGFTDFYGFLQGQRRYFPIGKPTRLNQLLRDREPVRPESFDYLTDELAHAAAEYIADTKDKPFFIYLAFNATHGPSDALESDLAAVGEDAPKAKLRAMTIALDRAVGEVLDTLEKQGIADNTLVFFLNDNGGAAGHDNAPLRGHKGQTWEGGTRVAFSARWPAVLPKGKVYDDPVITLDIFPTALAAAGITVPPPRPLDGVNLIPYFTDQATGRPHEMLFWKNGPAWAVREGDLKAVFNRGECQNSLFDLAADPAETHDLAAERPVDVRRLTTAYEAWKRDFPRPTWGGGAKEED